MLPVEVASVTAASPVVISSAATEPAEPPIPRLAGVIFLRTPPSLTKTKFASPLLVVVVGSDAFRDLMMTYQHLAIQ